MPDPQTQDQSQPLLPGFTPIDSSHPAAPASPSLAPASTPSSQTPTSALLPGFQPLNQPNTASQSDTLPDDVAARHARLAADRQAAGGMRTDVGVLEGVKRNTVDALTGLYHAFNDPATNQEKATILAKIRKANAQGDNWPEELALNPSRATLAYHRIIDAPADVLAEKSQDEVGAAQDLLNNHEYWKGGNLYLSGLTDKILSGVPLAGPALNQIAERAEGGDYSGAATDIAALVAAEHAPKIIKSGAEAVGKAANKVGEATSKAASAITKPTDEALAASKDFKKAIPPTKTTPYSEDDYQTARNYLEKHHAIEGNEIRNVQDVRDAADIEVKNIENKISEHVGIIPKEPIATNVLDDVRNDLRPTDEIKKGFLEAGLKALEPYNLDNPTMEQADAIRRQLNAENEGVMTANKWDRAQARATDPAFAAREAAAESLRNGIYDQLEEHGIEGVRDMRLDEGSLIKVRDAAERQIYNGDKIVRGTGTTSTLRKIGGKTAVGVGALTGGGLGAAIAGPYGAATGAAAGGVLGDVVGKVIAPEDISRDALVERSFAKKAAVGEPTQPKVNLKAPKPKGPAKGTQGELPLGPSTLFDIGHPTEIWDNLSDQQKAALQEPLTRGYNAVLDSPDATAAEKAQAKSELEKIKNTTAPQDLKNKIPEPIGPKSPGTAVLAKNVQDELDRRAEPYKKILDSPDTTAVEKAEAHQKMSEIYSQVGQLLRFLSASEK